MRQQSLIDLPPVDLAYYEDSLHTEGFHRIAGLDEAGRGCLAGPVVAASVILPAGTKIEGLKDSKQLTQKRREELFDVIHREAFSVGVGVVDSKEIDEINILAASLKAMRIAVDGLSANPDYLLIDGTFCIEHPAPQRAIKKGDGASISIAAASVIAKVTRDRMMCDVEKSYPGFSFSIHKGYGTSLHLSELKQHGPTPIHRKTFKPVNGEEYLVNSRQKKRL